MLTVFRTGSKKVFGLLRNGVSIVQVANLTGRQSRGEPLTLKKGFPYRKRFITQIEAFWDTTVLRVEQENAKLIVVDGPIAAGKTAAIKLLAEEFDMLYMSEPTMDQMYITRTGFDLRTLDDQLPESVRSFDHKNFLTCPHDIKTGAFQMQMLQLRFAQYTDALAHILNTGQGVIMERSPFSEYAFAEAMYSEGFTTKAVRDAYTLLKEYACPLLLRPHVVIYLDIPVLKVQERIKARNLSYEVNSPALTPSFLQKLEDTWKYDYLKAASDHSEILVYDWSDGGDIDTIVEDLEKLDLNPLTKPNYGKLSDWKTWRTNWRERRIRYTNEKMDLLSLIRLPIIDVEELMVPTKDFEKRHDIYAKAPGNEYAYGYNPAHGDSIFRILLDMPEKDPRAIGSFIYRN